MKQAEISEFEEADCMKKAKLTLSILVLLCAVLILCYGVPQMNNSTEVPPEEETNPPEENPPKEDQEEIRMLVRIGNQTFNAVMYDNDSVRALLSMLPLDVQMSELNGNEKYFYLPERLPVNSERTGTINTGDLMLYGNNCLVLFYDDFSTPYSYTRLGYVENPSGLIQALGQGSVNVSFSTI